MRHLTLIARFDEYDTAPGLAIVGVSDFEGFAADRDGLMIAHDLLEHQNGAKHMGPVWDELEALGAVWQVRGRWGDMCQSHPSMHSVETNLASDVTRMFPEWISEHRYNGPGGLAVGSRPHDDDETFLAVCEIARHDIPREYGDEHGGCESAEIANYLEDYLRLALHRMRSGFRKAERRFGNRFAGINQFKAVKDAVAGIMREVEYEGQRFRLSYGNGQATCSEIYEPDFY